MMPMSGSLMGPNAVTTLRYSGWAMNSVSTRIYSSVRCAFATPMGPLRKLIGPRRPEWFNPFCEPGAVCNSRRTRSPYLRAHLSAFSAYVQAVLARNGSPGHTSIAQ